MVNLRSRKGFTPLESTAIYGGDKRYKKAQSFLTGFTLLELIVVLVVLAALVAIALPQYVGFVERAKAAEAINAMASIKAGQVNYLSILGARVTGCTMLTKQVRFLPSSQRFRFTPGSTG